MCLSVTLELYVCVHGFRYMGHWDMGHRDTLVECDVGTWDIGTLYVAVGIWDMGHRDIGTH